MRCAALSGLTMRVLLFLSALLSAMVAVGTPATAAVRAPCAVSATATARVERPAPRITIALVRNLAASGSRKVVTTALRGAPARSVPLYAERLRV